MKKLMFAIAAMVCGSALFAEEITSANIVGYAKNAAAAGYSLSSIQFNAISQKSYKLSDLIPLHADGSAVEDAGAMLSIQTFDADANMSAMYFWEGPEDDPDTYTKLGWYDGNDEPADDIVIGEGVGFMVYSPFEEGELVLQVAGEVIVTQKEAVLTAGYSLCGNFCAMPIKLSAITPKHADDSDVEDAGAMLSIQTFDADANMAEMYFWEGPEDDPDTYESLGWYDGSDEPAGDVVFPASAGFMVYSPFEDGEAKLVFDAIVK